MFKALFGILCAYCVGALTPNTVSVSLTNKFVVPGDKTSLTCEGSSSQLSYYIDNRIEWRHTNKDGKHIYLTRGFYYEESSKNLFNGPQPRFQFDYEQTTKSFIFKISIKNITYQDDGIYTCSLNSSTGHILDSKEARLTVLHPVDTVILKIHDPESHVILDNQTTDIQGSEPSIVLKRGHYEASCVATGSNPAANVNVLYNGKSIEHPSGKDTMTISTDNKGERIKYTTKYNAKNLLLVPSEIVHYLTCSANFSGNFFAPIRVGIKIKVNLIKPNITCLNATDMVLEDTDSVIIRCNITALDDILDCEEVRWEFGDSNQTLSANERWVNGTNVDSSCRLDDQGLFVALSFNKIMHIQSDIVISLSYGEGERHQLVIKGTPAGSNFITPLSIFSYYIIGLFTRYSV